MKHKTGIFAIGLFVVLGVLWLFLNGASQHMEKSNQFSLSEIKYDDSTYRYVKEKCDSGFFEYNSENCINLRQAR